MYIDEEEAETLHKMFAKCGPVFIALGDEIRQKLILDIIDAGGDGVNVMTLTSKSHLSRPAISHHLKVLKDAGFLTSIKHGTQVFYRLQVAEKFAEMEELVHKTLNIMEKVRILQGKDSNTENS